MIDTFSLLSALKSTNALISFLFSDDFSKTIALCVGDIHLEAANFSYEMSNTTGDKKERIKSIITHLEVAHVSYLRIHKKYNNIGYRTYDSAIFVESVHNDVLVCCLMAICYIYLEEKNSARKCISLADNAFNNKLEAFNYQGNAFTKILDACLMPFGLINPETWKSGGAMLMENEYEEVKKSIESFL